MKRQQYKLSTPYLHSRTGHWVQQISLGTDPSGKRKRRTFTAKTKKELQAKVARYIEIHRPFQRTPTGRTVTTYLTEWYESKKPDWSPRTQELYLHQMEKHIIPAIGHIQLEDLTPLQVQHMLNKTVAAGKVPTANKCRRLLYTALKQALRWELIAKNPVEAVDPIREPERRIVVWEPREAQKFLDSIVDHRLFAAFYILLSTGIRRGELLGLRWSDVRDGGLWIEQALVLVGNTPTIGRPKTRRSRRFVPLAADTLDVLAAHHEYQQREREVCGRAWSDNGLVFCTSTGTPIHPRNFHRTLKIYTKRAKLPSTSIHSLRHLHASLLIAKGVDVKSISERLGHSSSAFTLDRYGHIFKQHQRKWALSVPQLLQTDKDGQLADD